MGKNHNGAKWIDGVGWVYPNRGRNHGWTGRDKGNGQQRRPGAEENLRAAQQQAEQQITEANAALAAGRPPALDGTRH